MGLWWTSPQPRRLRPTGRPDAAPRHARKLIHATIATLNAVGYTATTTIEVVRRAKVSRGAMLHHFSTRAELLLATAEHILREQEYERRDSLRAVERGEARFFSITDAIWNTMQRPEAIALTEIMLGARSDPEIHAPFSVLMREFNRTLLDGQERSRRGRRLCRYRGSFARWRGCTSRRCAGW